MGSNDNIIINFINVDLIDKNNNIIFQNLNFSIYEGEKVFICGHKDSDRTLILQAILGLIIPLNGKIKLFGKNLLLLRQNDLLNIRKDIGYVFPQKGLLRNLTIEENILLPLVYCSNLSNSEINLILNKILHFFNLEEYKRKEAWEVDNLIEKKTLIARAVVNRPKLLLIDEPTTYIEQKDIIEIKNIIEKVIDKEFLPEKKTMIITTEDINWALESKTKIIFLKDGKIIDFYF